MPLPLEKIRIIDVTEVWAGPMSTSLLADLGAEVIRVESFPRAPTNRPPVAPAGGRMLVDLDATAPRPWDRYAINNMSNRNKKGITLDLSRPKGKEIFKRLVAASDIVIEGYSAGTMQNLELDYPVLREVKPDIIMLSAPGWGEDGPYQGYVTLGNSIDSYTGHHLMRGHPGDDPTLTTPSVHSDAVVAATIPFAALTALHYRMRTGKGQWIDMSQAEGLLPNLGWAWMDYAMNGRSPTQMGNRDRRMAPHGCYPCQGEEEYVVISVSNDDEFARLCRTIGRPELLGDPRFADVPSRFENQDELDRIIGEWTSQHTHYEVMKDLQAAGVASGPVMRDYEAYSDPHLEARGFYETVTHPVAGTHRYPGMLWKMPSTPISIRIPPTALGQFNEYVYIELLGLSKEEVATLETERYIGTEYAPDASIDARDRVPTSS